MIDLVEFFTPVGDVPTQEDIDELLAITRLPKRKVRHRDDAFKIVGALPTRSIRFPDHYMMSIQWDDGEWDIAYQCGYCRNVLHETYLEWHVRTFHGDRRG